jgi:hypothetical protein
VPYKYLRRNNDSSQIPFVYEILWRTSIECLLNADILWKLKGISKGNFYFTNTFLRVPRPSLAKK